MTKRKAVLSGVAAVVAVSLISFPYVASPDWTVWVTDESGRPVQNAAVRLFYGNYCAEAAGHEEDQATDEHGYARFAAHKASASLLQRCWFSGLSALALAHASFGRHATVFAFGSGVQGDAVSNGIITDWTGKPERMESRIILRPTPQ